ncbi:hypothetical protein CRE_22334 [Caenorhabditis remanei]|uniref:Uncharacterized protein n=1 Tax=Caenorhabditis remanei TaxID=31234 RepID=E3ME67_CAERE|nr:hypothetical protein CRE_22334 [Caenorhabditis remanei]
MAAEMEHNISTEEDDDGFEDCVPGGLRPNYKIPIILSEMKEDVLDEIIHSENNSLSCASCSAHFTDFTEMKTHLESCSEIPDKNHVTEYKISQYHTNALIVSIKDMYEAGTSGLNPVKTETRLPFYMEPFAGANVENHNRIGGHFAVVTCRMCKCQYLHRSHELTTDNFGLVGVLNEDEQEFDPSLIKYHVKLCPEYEHTHETFLMKMDPIVGKIHYHYNELFNVYKTIRSGIYGSGFKIRTTSDPYSWREMGTIYEVDESNRGLLNEIERVGQPSQFQYFDFKLHNIEPENVDFVRTNYFDMLDETLDKIFFTRVTGL